MQEYEQAVFISYAWGGESEEIVDQICQALEQRGLKIIRDKRDLGYKGSISAFMERMGQANCVIAVISDEYLRSPNCMFELVEIAEGKGFHDRIFPIVLSSAEIYDPVRRLEYVKHWEMKRGELAQAMKEVDPANLQGLREDMDLYDHIRDKISGLASILKDMNTLTPDLHRDSDFSELYAGIERRMAQARGLLKPETGESPYMGLRYFDTSDADLFYGRETLTEELLRRVQKETFLAIVGASGSGKSSVARAGLIPAWRAARMGAVHVITPTARPLESLAASLTRESESVTATSTLMDDLLKEARSLRLYIRKVLISSGGSNLLLVVDQFEETFTLCKDPAERKAFIENLLSLAEDDPARAAARLVITLRADLYHHCAEYEGLRLALEKHQAYIGAMTSGGLDGTARVWDARSGEEVARMTHHDDYVIFITFSPDGKYVLSQSADRTAHVWEAASGEEVARMTHDGGVSCVAFSPDGKYVVSGSRDRTARVWDAMSGEQLARMTHDDYVFSVAFSPDGKYVVSGSQDRAARVWEYLPEDLIATACAHAPRNLTLTEWSTFIRDALPYQAVCPDLPVEP